MWTWNPSKVGDARGRREEDLARYLEVEYGEEEVGWLLAQARTLGRSFHGGVWHQLRRRLAGHRENVGAEAFCLHPGPHGLHKCS